MKNFLKQFASLLLFVVVAFLAVGYYLNYKADGELAFTPRDIVVYSTSDLSKASYSLEAGESFIALTNFSEDDSIKIRFYDSELEKEEVGFIRSSDCYIYTFPLNSTNNSDSIILSVDATVSFEDFLEEFAYLLHERGVVGIYLEDSDYSENNFLQISAFCEDLKIPYGLKSKFNTVSVENYIDKISFEFDQSFQSYNVLPHVFDVNAIMDGHKFEDELSNCIFKASLVRKDNVRRYWITSIGSQTLYDDEVLLMTYENFYGFEYALLSSEFKDEIADIYERLNGNL